MAGIISSGVIDGHQVFISLYLRTVSLTRIETGVIGLTWSFISVSSSFHIAVA